MDILSAHTNRGVPLRNGCDKIIHIINSCINNKEQDDDDDDDGDDGGDDGNIDFILPPIRQWEGMEQEYFTRLDQLCE
jgi:hypothetical protein